VVAGGGHHPAELALSALSALAADCGLSAGAGAGTRAGAGASATAAARGARVGAGACVDAGESAEVACERGGTAGWAVCTAGAAAGESAADSFGLSALSGLGSTKPGSSGLSKGESEDSAALWFGLSALSGLSSTLLTVIAPPSSAISDRSLSAVVAAALPVTPSTAAAPTAVQVLAILIVAPSAGALCWRRLTRSLRREDEVSRRGG
jgi:hypothetical protein